MSYIKIRNVNKEFNGIKVLKDINIDIEKGEFVSLLGPSGCGKTTLLRIVSGLETLNSGNITVEDRDITNEPTYNRGIGIVFQNYVLFPNLTVFENIAYGLKNKKVSKGEINEKVLSILNKIDLIKFKDAYPKTLSGGQQQRVAIARAIVLSPKILLLDEPLSALDAKVRDSLRYEIKRIQKEFNITTIMVTHDQEEALTMSDKIVVINKGNIDQIGSPEEVYRNPTTSFVANFIGKINILENKNMIRPEDINLSDYKNEKGVACAIKNIEFRGAFYRVIVENENDEEIIIDLNSRSEEILKKGSKLYYDLLEV